MEAAWVREMVRTAAWIWEVDRELVAVREVGAEQVHQDLDLAVEADPGLEFVRERALELVVKPEREVEAAEAVDPGLARG